MLVWVSINKNMADSQVDPINVPLAVLTIDALIIIFQGCMSLKPRRTTR